MTETKITWKTLMKGAVVGGTAIYCGNLFAMVVPAEQGILARGLAAIGGTALGGWLGLEASNGIEYRINEAIRKLDESRVNTSEVKVNG